MEEKIQVPLSHFKYLLPGYQTRLKEIDAVLHEMQDSVKKVEFEREDIKKMINLIIEATSDEVENITDAGLLTNTPIGNNYNKNFSWFEKAKFILLKEKKQLSTAEIIDKLYFYEPDLNRLRAIKSLSSVLGNKSNEGKEIERFVIKGYGQKFGLK